LLADGSCLVKDGRRIGQLAWFGGLRLTAMILMGTLRWLLGAMHLGAMPGSLCGKNAVHP